MSLKFDVDLIFDGVEQSGARKQDFQRAVQLVKSGKFKSSLTERAKMLDLRKLSDFLAGGVGSKRFEPALAGYFGEPRNQASYSSKDSVPDVELEYDDLVRIYGEETAQLFTRDEDVTDVSRRTIEIKQKTSSKDNKTQFTQLGAAEGQFSSEIAAIRSQALEKVKIKDGKEQVTRYVTDQNKMFDWFESPKQTRYREALLKQFSQKMQNFQLFSYTDGKVKVYIVPGLAKLININSKAERRKYFKLEYRSRGSRAAEGSVEIKTTPAYDKKIKDAMIDVTDKLMNAVAENFTQNLLQYYVKGEGANVLQKLGANTKYGFVNAFAEILLLAREFDPQFGGKPFDFRVASKDNKFGSIAAATKIKTDSTPKKKDRSLVQEAVSDVQIQEIARRAFVARMPKDRGQPPTPGILTYRSGRFAQSFQITKINQQVNQITYTYDPVYFVHDAKFKGKTLVEGAIRDAVRQVLKTNDRYKLVRR